MLLSPDLSALVRWGRFTPGTVALGVGGGVLAAAPVLLLSMLSSNAERGGPVAAGLLPVLLWFSMSGNLAEEVLFRAYRGVIPAAIAHGLAIFLLASGLP